MRATPRFLATAALLVPLACGAATPASAPESAPEIAGQPLAGEAGTITSTAGDRSALQLTVYADGIALVRDVRELALLAGRNPLRLEDLSPALIADSLALEISPEAGVTELRLPAGEPSLGALRRHYLGRRVNLLPADGSRGGQRSGLLVGAGEPPLVLVDERLEALGPDAPWRLAFPPPWPDLGVPTALTAVAVTERSGSRSAELHYLSEGLDWNVDYVGRLQGDRLELTGFATLANATGLALPQARVRLVAGTVNRVRRSRAMEAMQARASMADAMPRAEAGFEYHVYALGNPVSLDDGERRRFRLLERSFEGVERRYRVQAPGPLRPAAGETPLPVEVALAFGNGEAGADPLPGGVARIYGEHQGTPWFLGEDRLPHTPGAAPVELTLGQAFDLRAQRVQTEYQRRGERGWEAAWELTLHNARPEAVTVEVVEPVPPGAQLVSASAEAARPAADRLVWQLQVPAGGEAALSYRLRDG